MTRGKTTFKRIYLIYLGVLAALMAGAVTYVYVLLRQYEAAQPQRRAMEAAEELADLAAGGTFLETYPLPQADPGPYEEGRDIRAEYLALYAGELTVTRSAGSAQGETLEYQVERDGVVLARVGLRAEGEPVTRLAVFTLQDWAVDYIRPELEARDYTLTVPDSFSVSLNGTPLSAPAEGGESTYAVSGLYLPPDFAITDGTGQPVSYTIRGGKVLAEYYRYSLTLPAALTVTVNGQVMAGQARGDNQRGYEILTLDKPEVRVSDGYGNEVAYEGEDRLPLTSCTITAPESYTVTVDGAAVPDGAVERMPNPDYQHFADYVEGLPQLCRYAVAVLREGAELSVTDGQGNPVALEAGRSSYDLSAPAGGLDEVPQAVSSQIDVLQVAQSWSLFMSNDLAFSRIDDYLISSSYQYEVALKYATGEDITFTSSHTLENPAFTDTMVSNFTWITDDCFSVDIRFVKHMRLRTGAAVDDPMNDRFYFVRYDDTADGADNPAWKLASMKEILHDAEQ